MKWRQGDGLWTVKVIVSASLTPLSTHTTHISLIGKIPGLVAIDSLGRIPKAWQKLLVPFERMATEVEKLLRDGLMCPICGKQLPPGTRFCPNDGTAIARKCPKCGHYTKNKRTEKLQTVLDEITDIPLPQPVHDLRLSVRHAAKYAVLVSLTERMRRGFDGLYYVGVQQGITMLSEWMAPEWQIAILGRDTGNPQIALRACVGQNYILAHQGSIANFEVDFSLSEMIKDFSDDQKQEVEHKAAEILEELVVFEETLKEKSERCEEFFSELEAQEGELQKAISEALHSAWTDLIDSLSEEHLGEMSYRQATFLAKYILYARILQLTRAGLVDISYLFFASWSYFWSKPEFKVNDYLERGALFLLEKCNVENGYPDHIASRYINYPVFRSDIHHFEANVPMAEQLKSLQPAQVTLILNLAFELAKLLDSHLYSSELLRDDPRSQLSEILSPQDLALALPPENINARGIAMLDMGMATKWQAVQFCKAVMCVALNWVIMNEKLKVNGLVNDPNSCARWSALWLRPHWEMVIDEQPAEPTLSNVNIQLYPVHEFTRDREAIYFSGQFLDLVGDPFSSVVITDIDHLAHADWIIDVVEWAMFQYGKTTSITEDPDADYSSFGLVAIVPGDESLEKKVQFNDNVLLAWLEDKGMQGIF